MNAELSIDITVVVIAFFILVIAGVIIAAIYRQGHRRHKMKFNTLRGVFANRFDLKRDVLSSAANEVFETFNDSREVMDALSELLAKMVEEQNSDEEIDRLFKTMCEDLKLHNNQFNF